MPLNRKIAYIDLTTGDIQTKPIPLEIRKKFLGGRGLDAYLLYNHTKKGCDPIGPDNTLMVSGGILCATLASATSRCHVMAKSPLTGLLGSANMGGFFTPEMAWAGFHHLVIKGKAKHPVYLFIHNGEIEIRDARDLWGLSVTETQWAIRDELGDQEVKSMVCGPAGENLVTYANVMTGIKNAGGRTGMGCVMGSKNLKADRRQRNHGHQDRPPCGGLGIQQTLHRADHQRQSEPDPGSPRHPVYLGSHQLLGRRSGPGTSSTTSASMPMTSNRSTSTKSQQKPAGLTT